MGYRGDGLLNVHGEGSILQHQSKVNYEKDNGCNLLINLVFIRFSKIDVFITEGIYIENFEEKPRLKIFDGYANEG